MNETVSSKAQVTEFDKLLAESINKSNLKRGDTPKAVANL